MERDLEELLGTAAGKRLVGYILDTFGLWAAVPQGEFQQGQRAVAARLANSVRDIDPRLVGECDAAWREFLKRYDEEEEYDGDGSYGGTV